MSLILLRSSCTAGNKPPILTVWLYYVSAMFYDLLTLGISTYYLIGFGPNFGKLGRPLSMFSMTVLNPFRSNRMGRLVRMYGATMPCSLS